MSRGDPEDSGMSRGCLGGSGVEGRILGVFSGVFLEPQALESRREYSPWNPRHGTLVSQWY